MPNELVQFKPRDEILTFEEIVRFVSVVATTGVNKLRLTGGEPLLRAEAKCGDVRPNSELCGTLHSANAMLTR